MQLTVPDHVVFFSQKTLTRLLEETGIEVNNLSFPYKILSARAFIFHCRCYSELSSESIMKLSEITGLADNTISIPQWDEMLLFSTKKE